MPSAEKQFDGPKRYKITKIPPKAEEHEVKIAIAKAYHTAIAQISRRRQNDSKEEDDGPILMNFEVKLHKWEDESGWLKPTGTLLLPRWSKRFEEYIATNAVLVPYYPDWNDKGTIASDPIHFVADERPYRAWAEVNHLKSTPWQNPRTEVEHKERVKKLQPRCQIMNIQFGFDHFRTISKPAKKTVHHFVVEWCRTFDSNTDARASMEFSDAIHSIEITIGDHMNVDHDFIKVRYDNVKEIAVKSTTIIFTLWSSPILERGPKEYNESMPRSRLSGLDEQHKRIMSIFPNKRFRVTLYSQEEMDSFKAMASVVGLKVFSAHRCTDTDNGLGEDLSLKTTKRVKRRAGDYLNHLTDGKMKEINDKWLGGVPFEVAFQLASLLQNGLLNPIEIRSMRPWIDQLLAHEPKRSRREVANEVAELLYHFSRSIPSWTIDTRLNSDLEGRFNKFKEEFWANKSDLPKNAKLGWFPCYRANITPTRLTLDGPSQEQSNGVIRRYQDDSHAFLRVNFTDEDRVQVRWDRDIDGESFVRERLGGFLHSGIEIGGRKFDFLGYSNSGLREHSLWFVTPFMDKSKRMVDANVIRREIGDFSDSVFSDKLEHQPAKLGARLAQAFSSTEPSVELEKEEIDVIKDILADPVFIDVEESTKTESEDGNDADAEYTEDESKTKVVKSPVKIIREFTDGYGYMSPQLSREIWERLNPDVNPLPEPAPASYQIRIGGAKGVIGINPNLEGRKVVLHKSMVKFESEDRGLHIATKFDHPLRLFLNRPLVAILEHQGVEVEWFKKLQNNAISEVDNMFLSISEKTADFFTSRRLGRPYGVGSILHYLAINGITRVQLQEAPHPWLDFYLTSLEIARVHIYRELKYRARIPVPQGVSLVGVADIHGELDEGEVYICIQRSGQKSQYFPDEPSMVYVTRSPSIHPGDVQKFKAMHPFKGSIYEENPMRNCIVFSTKGSRPPASMLGGGDLDGDLFQIIPESESEGFKPQVDRAAEYRPVTPLTLKDRPATIDDIADFVVDYVNSDKMGLISIQHLIISDQSRRGLHDPRCLKLAELHSNAVDFAKSGVPVSFKDLPRKLHRFVPDFQFKETKLDDTTKYYESPKALGVLFRNIKVKTVAPIQPDPEPTPLAEHPIWKLLLEKSLPHLPKGAGKLQEAHVKNTFNAYVRELKGIKGIYTLGRTPLSEAEVFMGTILEQSNNRRREDMAAMLREVSGQLVSQIQSSFMGFKEDPLHVWLARSLYGWQWAYSEAASKNPDGMVVKDRKEAQCSFGMIALRSAFECLDVIHKRRLDQRRSKLS